MSNLSDKVGGVGRIILKAVPYVATYFLGRKLGQRGTRKEAKREMLEQRELGEHEAQGVRDQLKKKPTGDYIRRKDI
jgi:hypothetical protein